MGTGQVARVCVYAGTLRPLFKIERDSCGMWATGSAVQNGLGMAGPMAADRFSQMTEHLRTIKEIGAASEPGLAVGFWGSFRKSMQRQVVCLDS